MAFYIADMTKQSESKLEKSVSPSVLKEEENKEKVKWRCPKCKKMEFIGKDCCKKGLYDYSGVHDLHRLLVTAESEIKDEQKQKPLNSHDMGSAPSNGPNKPIISTIKPEPAHGEPKPASNPTKNIEKYWRCHRCDTVNRTELRGKSQPCTNCKFVTYSRMAEIDPSKKEVIYG